MIDEKKLIYWIKSHCNPYGKPDLGFDTSIKIMEFIEKQMEKVGEWIPCSDRLPEDRKEKMVYLSSNRITIAKYNERRLPHTGYPIGWGYIPKNGYIDFENETVIAWIPLPEPYNSKGE